MWSPRALARLVAILALAALAGCFRPMYGQIGDGPAVIDELARITIAPIEGRVGQKVRNELVYAFSAGAADDAPYSLAISLRETTEDMMLRRTSDPITTIYDLRANFTLIDVASGKVLHGGSAVARASYDRGTQIFANERALLNAQNRAAKVIADNVKTRVAAYFAARGG